MSFFGGQNDSDDDFTERDWIGNETGSNDSYDNDSDDDWEED